MPNFKGITEAREKARCIREYAGSFRTESARVDQSIKETSKPAVSVAAHDREDEDGTMYFESGQLDGCNGLAREANGVWMSVCFTPTAPDTDTQNPTQGTAGGVE
jgi:hypothetical protein